MPPHRTTTPYDEAILSEDDLVAPLRDPQAGRKRKADPATKKGSRQALKDRTNVTNASDDRAIDEQPAKRSKKSAIAAPNRHTKQKSQIEPVATDTDQSRTEFVEAAPPSIQLSERTTNARQVSDPPTCHNSTQPEARQTSYAHGRSVVANVAEQERSVSKHEIIHPVSAKTRGSDNLQPRNQKIEELMSTRVENNFDKLKAEADQKSERADDLIASLRKEIALLRKNCTSSSAETTALQKQVRNLTEDCEAQTSENKRLVEESKKLVNDFKACEHNKQTLEVRLVALRQQLGGTSSDGRTINMTDSQKELKMKENLYSDLTGLIIRGVKRKEGEDEYDCIQTGRNGTLHFRLSVVNETGGNHPKTPSAYEDAEFSYEPKLDEKRDQMLLDILPDYLSEDICFPRNQAVKFYSKVAESMTKRIVVEEDDV